VPEEPELPELPEEPVAPEVPAPVVPVLLPEESVPGMPVLPDMPGELLVVPEEPEPMSDDDPDPLRSVDEQAIRKTHAKGIIHLVIKNSVKNKKGSTPKSRRTVTLHVPTVGRSNAEREVPCLFCVEVESLRQVNWEG
jgi:hypothetical protein